MTAPPSPAGVERLAPFLAAEGRRFRTRKFRHAFRDLGPEGRAALAPAALAGLAALAPTARILRRLIRRPTPLEEAAAALLTGCALRDLPLDRAAALAPLPAARRAGAARAADEAAAELAATPAGRHLHPAWFHRFLVDRFGAAGPETAMTFHDGPADQFLLVSPASDPAAVAAEVADACGVAPEPLAGALLRLPLSPLALDLEALRAVREGRAHPASAPAAAMAEFAAGAAAPSLDLCAAPGGKSAALLNARRPGLLVAGDVKWNKARELATRIARHGAGRAAVVVHDGRRPPYRDGAFGLVVVDAPCSGSGLLRRRPELRSRLRPEDLVANLPLQRALLAAAAPLVAPGGRLLYATCSLDRRENAGQVDAFLATHPCFARAEVKGGPVSAAFGFRAEQEIDPVRHGLDGFYFCLLENRR